MTAARLLAFRFFLLALLPSFFLPVSGLMAQSSLLRSGPMVGYAEMRQVLLWVQTAGTARVQFFYREKGTTGRMERTAEVTTRSEDAFVAKILVARLEPGSRYIYEVHIDGSRVPTPWPLEFQTLRGRLREDSSSFTVALGSCALIVENAAAEGRSSYTGDYSIFTSIAARRPDLMLWLGDNIYLGESDWTTREGFLHRYTHGRSLSELQPLLGSTHHYAIWDDNDYGHSDADRGFRQKDVSRATFELFWGNPPDGAAPAPGINTSFRWADAEFFLLDNRTWRSPNRAKSGRREILGEEQIRWLLDRLATSSATFKIIAVGGQTLNPAPVYENHATYPEERARLLELIAQEGTPGIIFLSGDRHHSELTMMPRATGYPLYDLTISPLTSRAYLDTTEANSFRVPGTYIGTQNFGTLEFSGAGRTRGIRVRTFDAAGREIWTRWIGVEELGY